MILSDYAFQKRLSLVLKYLSPNDAILDFGAGSQRLTKILLNKGFNVKSLDVAPEFECDFTASGNDTKLPPESFDKIIAIEVLEHGFFIDEIERILRPGGQVIFTIPNPRTELFLDILIRAGLVKDKVTPHINLRLPKQHETEKLKIVFEKKLFAGLDYFGVLEKIK